MSEPSITFNGRRYALAALSYEDQGSIEAGGHQEHVEAQLQGMTKIERMFLLACVYEYVSKGYELPKMTGVEAAAAVARGFRRMLTLSLLRGNPGLSDADAAAVVDGIDAKTLVDAMTSIEELTSAANRPVMDAFLRFARFNDITRVFTTGPRA